MRHTATETNNEDKERERGGGGGDVTNRDINKRRQGQMHRGERKWMGVLV